MTSNRPTNQRTLDLPCTEEPDARGTLELQQAEQTAPAAMEKPALNTISEDLMERIVDQANFEQAWKNVKANRGAPGPDGVTLDEFFETFPHHWQDIRRQLLEGTYVPGPARRKSIPKPDGSPRHLGIPNVIDRVIQQAILQVLTPIFDPTFSESSFGFRPGRSAHDAAKQVQTHIQNGYRHCVDMDLSKFFDRVQHDVLMARVSRKVKDKRLLKLIGRYLRAGVMVDTDLQPSTEGTMQGGPLSPLLANILLDDFDKELESRGHRFVRYADDFLVFTKTSKGAERVFRSVERYLTRKLKLIVNHDKSRTCSSDGVEFLGFEFRGEQGRIRVAKKNYVKFKSRVRQITRRNRGVSFAQRCKELRPYFNGWVGYFRLLPTGALYRDLDQWVRRRIRMCIWHQWRRPRTRIANLLRLGVPEKDALSHGKSSKGAWVLSSSRAVHRGLSNALLEERGLPSILAIWEKFTAKDRIA